MAFLLILHFKRRINFPFSMHFAQIWPLFWLSFRYGQSLGIFNEFSIQNCLFLGTKTSCPHSKILSFSNFFSSDLINHKLKSSSTAFSLTTRSWSTRKEFWISNKSCNVKISKRETLDTTQSPISIVPNMPHKRSPINRLQPPVIHPLIFTPSKTRLTLVKLVR